MKNQCQDVQEKIAFNENFSVQDQTHLNRCLNCKSALAEHQAMATLLDPHKDVDIPSGFADRVMSEVLLFHQRKNRIEQSKSKFRKFFMQEITYAPLKADSSVGLLSFVRLVAFVFIVFIPANM